VRRAQDRGFLEKMLYVILKQDSILKKKISTHLRGKHEGKEAILVILSRIKQFSKVSKQKLGY
jgi:hypothetical protein